MKKVVVLPVVLGAIVCGFVSFCGVDSWCNLHGAESDLFPLSYEQIAAISHSMDPVQAKAYLRNLTGQRVRWQGRVYRVYQFSKLEKTGLKGRSVYIDMSRETASLDLPDPWEVELKIPQNAPIDFSNLDQNQPVLFTGTIELARFLMSSKHVKVTLKDVSATLVEQRQPESPAVSGVAYKILFPTSMFTEPREESREISRLGTGTQVYVVGTYGDWLKIRSKYGRPPGFIKKEAAARVNYP